MTTPESIVVSLDWAKKLKEAGWRQDEATFWWFFSESKLEGTEHHDLDKSYIQHFPEPWIEHDTFRRGTIPAPTAEEIMRKLPKQTADDNFLTISPEENGWAVYYETSDNQPRITYKADTLANAAAALACYLVEQGLLSFKKAERFTCKTC